MSKTSCLPRHKFSFTTMATPELDCKGAIALAARYGFRGVNLRVSDDSGEVSPGASLSDLAPVKREFDDHGLQIPSLFCYGIDLAGGADNMAGTLRRHLDMADALGSRWIRIFSGDVGQRGDKARYLEEYAKVLQTVLGEGRCAGVVIQNHKGDTDLPETLQLVRQVDSPRCGMVLSLEHCDPGIDVEAVLPACTPYIREMFVADRDADKSPVLPGRGLVPLRKAITLLERAGYTGFYIFKWERILYDIEPNEVAFPAFISFMRGILDGEETD